MLTAGTSCFPIYGFTDFQELYLSNHGMAENRQAGGFVNSTVISFSPKLWVWRPRAVNPGSATTQTCRYKW